MATDMKKSAPKSVPKSKGKPVATGGKGMKAAMPKSMGKAKAPKY